MIAATNEWIAKLDKKDADYEHHLLEALWVHQNHNVVNRDLLKKVLASQDRRARAAATRVLCYQREQISDALELLKGWRTTSIRACGSKRCGRPASSMPPTRSRSR